MSTTTTLTRIVATWHDCSSGRTEVRPELWPGGWNPDRLPADVMQITADELRGSPDVGRYLIQLRRDGRTTSTIAGGSCRPECSST